MEWIEDMRARVSSESLPVVAQVWNQRDAFIRWPKRGGCWWPGCVRVRFHRYSPAQRAELAARNIKADPRSNGPAIMSFLWADGERPDGCSPRKQWTIHHIYDGKFPAPNRDETAHAVKDGSLFPEAAGLVAVPLLPMRSPTRSRTSRGCFDLRHTDASDLIPTASSQRRSCHKAVEAERQGVRQTGSKR